MGVRVPPQRIYSTDADLHKKTGRRKALRPVFVVGSPFRNGRHTRFQVYPDGPTAVVVTTGMWTRRKIFIYLLLIILSHNEEDTSRGWQRVLSLIENKALFLFFLKQ